MEAPNWAIAAGGIEDVTIQLEELGCRVVKTTSVWEDLGLEEDSLGFNVHFGIWRPGKLVV